MLKRASNKREQDILEERGLWQASSFLGDQVKKLIKKNKPLHIGYIKSSHTILFNTAKQPEIAGKYRASNDIKIRRLKDSTYLKYTSWEKISYEMGVLSKELSQLTETIQAPKREEDYENIIISAARLSHKLACIHPFENGNGRMSRLLINAILLRVGLYPIPLMGHLKMTKDELKKVYLNAMYQADNKDFSQLENFIVKGIQISQGQELAIRTKKKKLITSSAKRRF